MRRTAITTTLAVVIAAVLAASASGAYHGRATSIHPGAINDATRNWTYLGDTVRVAFRNTALAPGSVQRYRVCYTKNFVLACQTRTLRGPGWDAWRLRILPPWAGYIRGAYVRYVGFTWRVGSRVVATHRAWVYE